MLILIANPLGNTCLTDKSFWPDCSAALGVQYAQDATLRFQQTFTSKVLHNLESRVKVRQENSVMPNFSVTLPKYLVLLGLLEEINLP